jgi:hypothetical protein
VKEREGRRRVPALASSLARPAAALACSLGGSVRNNQMEALTERRGFGGERESEREGGGKEPGTRMLIRRQCSLARPTVALARSFAR